MNDRKQRNKSKWLYSNVVVPAKVLKDSSNNKELFITYEFTYEKKESSEGILGDANEDAGVLDDHTRAINAAEDAGRLAGFFRNKRGKKNK